MILPNILNTDYDYCQLEIDKEISLNFISIYIILYITLYSFLKEFSLWPDEGPE